MRKNTNNNGRREFFKKVGLTAMVGILAKSLGGSTLIESSVEDCSSSDKEVYSNIDHVNTQNASGAYGAFEHPEHGTVYFALDMKPEAWTWNEWLDLLHESGKGCRHT